VAYSCRYSSGHNNFLFDQKRKLIYSNRPVSSILVLLELLTALLDYNYFAIVNFQQKILLHKYLLELSPMLLGTYYAQNDASIIGGPPLSSVWDCSLGMCDYVSGS